MRRSPEERGGERGEDDERAQPALRDEAREAGIDDAVGGLQRLAARESRYRVVRRRNVRPRRGDVEWALQQALRVCGQLVRDAVRRCADENLLPPDATRVVGV